MIKKIQVILLLSFAFNFIASAEYLEAGKKSFEMNCLACHQTDNFTVGPSSIEISKKYPKNQLTEFLAWANEPGKVNKKAIQMPSMAHVGKEALTNIHLYIIESSKGKKEKKKTKNPKSAYKGKKRTYPYVRRGYMPETSPASIGIVLSKEIAIAWDTTIANIRYAYIGESRYLHSHKLPKNIDTNAIIYKQKDEQLFSFSNPDIYHFIGYKLKNNLPEILYQYGDIQVSEIISSGKTNKSFIRAFSISGVTEPITLDLSHTSNAIISSNKGQIKNNQLTLSPSQAQQFSIEVTIK